MCARARACVLAEVGEVGAGAPQADSGCKPIPAPPRAPATKRRRIEQADLDLAKEFIGTGEDAEVEVLLIEAMEPVCKEDFAKLNAAICAKVGKYEVRAFRCAGRLACRQHDIPWPLHCLGAGGARRRRGSAPHHNARRTVPLHAAALRSPPALYFPAGLPVLPPNGAGFVPRPVHR